MARWAGVTKHLRRNSLITNSPEQSAVLESLINTASRATTVLSIALEITEGFISEADAFLRNHQEKLADKSFFLVLEPTASKNPGLSLQALINAVNSGHPILYLNEKLQLLRTSSGLAQLKHCSDLTKQEKLLGMFSNGGYVYSILDGLIVDEWWTRPNSAGIPTISKQSRPMEEFEILLQEHLKDWINSGEVPIWADRAQRILLSQPSGTELIFHTSLFTWLKLFVFPKLDIYAETSGLGQNKTDINVVTSSGTFVIEVKWLGKNDGGTVYKQIRINEGLAQVKIYLDNNSTFVCGHLVCYDGRLKELHETESSWNDSLRHPLCTNPHVLFLSSVSPSAAAKSIAKTSKT